MTLRASATKKWAYVTDDGSERVTADAVMRERWQYGGRSTGKTYYSTHRPPNRKPMEHVRVKATGASFFRYKNASDEDANAVGGGGESLQHRLFKEAVARAEFLDVRLPGRSHNLRILHGEVEKQIPVSETKNLFCDVFIGFECDTDLALKWESKLCIEVWHEHAVEPGKIDALRVLRVPTVEVKLPARLEYEYAEEDTTDEREQRYLERMSNVLKFIDAKIVSDPSSLEYLEKQLAQAKRSLALQADEVARLTREKTQLRESSDAALQNVENKWSTKHSDLLNSSTHEVQKTARVYRIILVIGVVLAFVAGFATATADWFDTPQPLSAACDRAMHANL